jgi:hypothetical protein
MPTIYELAEDDDFLPELRQNNELLLKFLTKENMIELMKLVTVEPGLNDMPNRCFKLPYVAT